MKYVIDSKTYEKHIRDEVHLYGLLHQLAFLAGKVKDEEDMANLVETSKHYGEIAEKKFDDWLIPGRYLAFGDRDDLAELKAAELTPLTAVLKENTGNYADKRTLLVMVAKQHPEIFLNWLRSESSVQLPAMIPPTSFPAAPSVCWWAISLTCWHSTDISVIVFWM